MNIKRVRSLLARNHSFRDIASYYGVSKSSVHRFVLKNIPDYKALMMSDSEVAAKVDRAYRKMFGHQWTNNDRVF